MVDAFLYSQPVRIWFGAGKLAELSSVFDAFHVRKAIIVADRFVSGKAEALREKDPRIESIFTGVEPNPQLHYAVSVAEAARETGADCIVGIGGGSVMDTAKFAAAIAPGNADAKDYYQGTVPFPGEPLTIITVPTTAGTGSEVTQVSVMNDGPEKRTINNPVFMAKAAIVDPELSATVPPYQTMITGLDAMAHALEGFWSKNHQPIPDLFAAEAVRLVLENLETAYRNGSDMNARTNMALAALYGGLAFALPKTAGCHACSYPLSEDYHLPHGEACAFTLDSFVIANRDDRLDRFTRGLGLRNAVELADRIRYLKSVAHLKSRLGDLGDVDVSKLARDAAAHPLMKNNPVPMDEHALRELFEALR